jgi:hypothetical protein
MAEPLKGGKRVFRSSPPQSFWPGWGQAGWRLNRGVEAERSQVGTRVQASRFYTAGDRLHAGAGTIHVDAISYLSATASPDTNRREEIIMTAPKLTRVLGGVFLVAVFVAIPMRASAQTSVSAFDIFLVDPCTGGNTVEAVGTETTTISTKVTGSGDLHLDISDVFKGTGADVLDATKTYTYSDNEQFSFTTPLPVGSATADSTFTQKIFVKGSKSLDNWMIKATITFKVNANGVVTKITSLTSDVCKG